MTTSMPVKTPEFLFDSYKAYKRDTQTVARWLAQSAKKCRQAISGKNTEKTETYASKNTDKESTDASLPALWEFVPLAKSVSESVEVPRGVISSLKSLIGKRKKCNAWFSGQAGDESHNSKNESHDHAISTFQRVLQILEPRVVPAPNIEPNLGPQKADQVPVNGFQALNVEDAFSDDDDPNDPCFQEKEPRTPHEHSSGPCQGCIQADLAFQCYCFYGDLDLYRSYLRLLWQHYRDGELDLMTVSVITDTTFDVLERAENEFSPDFSALEAEGAEAFQYLPKYERTAGYLYLKYCQCEGQDPMFREQPEDAGNMAMYETAAWLCMPTAQIIVDLFDELEPTGTGSVDMFPFRKQREPGNKLKESVPWESSPSGPWEELTPRERIKADSNMIKEFLFSMEVVRIIRKAGDKYDLGIHASPMQDRLSKGFLEALENRTRPKLWLIFATQIYLDIRHVLEKDSTRGLEELRSTAAESVATVKETMDEAIAGVTCEHWDFLNNKAFIDLTNAIMWWLGDDHVKWLFERFGGPKVLPPYHLLSIQPVLCGVMAFNITLTMQTLGLQYSSAWKATTAVAHLYNASLQSGLTTTSWPDMDTFIAIHPKTFFGERPKTPRDFRDQAIKAFEWVYVPDHLISKTKRRQAQKLGIKETCPLSSIFIKRYSFKDDAEDHVQITLHDVEALLDKSASREDVEISSTQPTAKRTKAGKAARNRHDRQTASRAALLKQIEETKRLGPLELLETLRLALGAELIPSLTFNYLRMHIRCMNILRDLRPILSSFVKAERPDLADSEMPENFLAHMVVFTLGRHAMADSIPLPDPFPPVCKALNPYIEREGDIENDRMAAMEDEWWRGGDRKKMDIMSEAKKLLEVIAGERAAPEYVAHFLKAHGEFVPFEHCYRPLYEEKKAKEVKEAGVEGEKPKKKRKRTKKKKSAKAANGEGAADGAGEIHESDAEDTAGET